MNRLLETVYAERKGHYCHALEVNDVSDLECVIESVIDTYSGFSEQEYIDFFTSIELYCLNEENENEVYDFSFSDYIEGTIS